MPVSDAGNPQQRWLEGVEAAAGRWAAAEREVTVDEWRAAMVAKADRVRASHWRAQHRHRKARTRRYFRVLWRALTGREE